MIIPWSVVISSEPGFIDKCVEMVKFRHILRYFKQDIGTLNWFDASHQSHSNNASKKNKILLMRLKMIYTSKQETILRTRKLLASLVWDTLGWCKQSPFLNTEKEAETEDGTVFCIIDISVWILLLPISSLWSLPTCRSSVKRISLYFALLMFETLWLTISVCIRWNFFYMRIPVHGRVRKPQFKI